MRIPIWLLESGGSNPDCDQLAGEIRRQSFPCVSITHRELVREGPPIRAGECVVVYGTYPFVRHAQIHAGWIPGAWLDPQRFDCGEYAPHFSDFLLNHRFEIVRGVDAIRDADRLFATFGPNDEVFARPTGVSKVFAGRCIYRDDWETALAPTRYDLETTILVSSPREIGREWRFVVVGNALVSECQYARDGRRNLEPGAPKEVAAFANHILGSVSWRPAEVFVLDICEVDGEYRVVEFNPFETSGVYFGNLEAIVRTVGEAAADNWAHRPSR